jgi:hypothetical protein
MAHGEPKGVVDAKFKDRVSDLEKKARAAADYFRDHGTYRDWHMPDAVKDPLDVPSLHNDAWDRNEINRIYSDEVLKGPGNVGGTCGDLIAMKWQADFMAVEERAFRTRHASMVRCAALAHGRLDGHGQTGKSIFSFLQDAVQSAINNGRGG